MIIRFDNTVTETAAGSQILQIDRDEIVSVKPRDKMKRAKTPADPPTGFYGMGSFTNLFRIFLDIKDRNNKTISIEFFDETFRNTALDNVLMEMTQYHPPISDNKFYKKEYKQANDAMAVAEKPKRKGIRA